MRGRHPLMRGWPFQASGRNFGSSIQLAPPPFCGVLLIVDNRVIVRLLTLFPYRQSLAPAQASPAAAGAIFMTPWPVTSPTSDPRLACRANGHFAFDALKNIAVTSVRALQFRRLFAAFVDEEERYHSLATDALEGLVTEHFPIADTASAGRRDSASRSGLGPCRRSFAGIT